ncbi:MAG: hypothetical protein Q8P18_20085 [Pseudomonadota bacterium]|nr:hypothetical protein [Pseudomonadota bacterium]
MKATKFHHDYPYRLRIQHPDYAEIRLERKGRFLRIDPVEAPAEDEVVVLTSSAPHRARGTVEALQAGRRLTIVASTSVLEWLGGLGTVDAHPFPATVDGVTIDAMAYTAPSIARPLSSFLRASVAGARAGGALKRIAEQVRFPAPEPHVIEVKLEDGGRLVHLDLALHKGTDPAWLERAAARFGGAEWLLVGIPWGEGEAVVRQVGRFGAKRVLLTELQNAERREMGLPTELVTPWRDKLLESGTETHVFATQASYRFE